MQRATTHRGAGRAVPPDQRHLSHRGGQPVEADRCTVPRATTSDRAASRHTPRSSGSATRATVAGQPDAAGPLVRHEGHAQGGAGGRGERPKAEEARPADERRAVEARHVGHVDVDRAQHAAEQPTDDRAREQVETRGEHVGGADRSFSAPAAGDVARDPDPRPRVRIVDREREAGGHEPVAADPVVGAADADRHRHPHGRHRSPLGSVVGRERARHRGQQRVVDRAVGGARRPPHGGQRALGDRQPAVEAALRELGRSRGRRGQHPTRRAAEADPGVQRRERVGGGLQQPAGRVGGAGHQ